MAQPPRNNPRDPSSGAQPKQGRSWGVYLAIIAIVLLVLYLLFGNVFSPDPVPDEDPAVETTTPDAGPDPVAPDADPAGGSETAPADPATGGDPTAPGDAAEEEEEEEDVIDIEGDAEVEVLDES
ncbi:MAG: hypothetical protein ACK4NW_13455 [Roseinatronobacter sp.]